VTWQRTATGRHELRDRDGRRVAVAHRRRDTLRWSWSVLRVRAWGETDSLDAAKRAAETAAGG